MSSARRNPVLTAALLAVCLPGGAAPARAQPGEPGAPAPAGASEPAAAPAPTPAPEPEDRLTVYLLTLGPGTHPFFKFGHNAIWIQETFPDRPPRGRVYNFGTFAFDTPGLISKFLRGRFRYWLSVAGIEETIAHYQAEDRTVIAQELALSAAQERELQAALERNALPEHRTYLYDYFRDNCSTRVRDALDAALGGQLRAALQTQPAQQSLRAHALRLTADLPWEYVALHYALSGAIDRIETRWDEAFVPELLRRMVAQVEVDGPEGPRPLQRAERTFYTSTRPPPPETPPDRLWAFLVLGLAAGAGLFGLARAARARRAARVALGLLLALLALVFGLLGLALLLLWLLTDHRAAYGNENLLQTAPFLLLLVPAALGLALGRARATRAAARLTLAAALVSLGGLLLKLSPASTQQSGEFIALFLPLWGGLALGLRALAHAVQGDGQDASSTAS